MTTPRPTAAQLRCIEAIYHHPWLWWAPRKVAESTLFACERHGWIVNELGGWAATAAGVAELDAYGLLDAGRAALTAAEEARA